MQNLVIVESPTKARMLSQFLGSKYQVEASMGHIRDLPKSEIGVDTDKFEPKYIVPRDKTKRVNELKKLAAGAKTLWLATDPDREGEAIAWHIKELLAQGSAKKPTNNKLTIQRVVFHEITLQAVMEAFEHPREINHQLVDAQQARRVLDRLVGYKLSPLLWKKVKSGLSAGRVQSVALRLIVERGSEVEAFKPQEYWSIEADLESEGSNFRANLIELDGKKLAIENELQAQGHVDVLKRSSYQVTKVIKKEVKRFASPPFTTSTLQQTASLKLGLTAKKTMSVAQFLYEHGMITYMRTDSVNLSQPAIEVVRDLIKSELGVQYVPAAAKLYKAKSKLVQEAHEAIRPTNIKVKAEDLKGSNGLTRDHIRLYDLIWKRTMACQMAEAVLDQTSIDVTASATTSSYLLRASGSVIKFDGWTRVYGTSQEEQGEDNQQPSQKLPELSEKEALKLIEINKLQHFTEPPPRYNEASLIKKLEELGIGRPSTYAPILSTIQERYYVEKKERKFYSTPLGAAVIEFLKQNFGDIVDYSFTAEMEDNLDQIAHGSRDWKQTLSQFYAPFEKKIEETEETAERVKIKTEEIDKDCPKCGSKLVVKFGKFGKFLACSGFPECKHTENFEQAVEGVVCPLCGGELVVRKTKRGRPFYGCKNWPNCKFASWTKPK